LAHSFVETLYILVLGEQDSETGIPRRGYTPTSISDSVVVRPNTASFSSGIGFYGGKEGTLYTQSDVHEGDIIKDSMGFYYQIMGRLPQTWGNTFVYYRCPLKELLDVDIRIPTSGGSPSADPNFYGFEQIDPGVTEFEDGFERGYFT